jgi:hypothetical protein
MGQTAITQEMYERTIVDIVYWTGQLPAVNSSFTMGASAILTLRPPVDDVDWLKCSFRYRDFSFFDLMDFVPNAQLSEPSLQPFQDLMVDLRSCCGDMTGLKGYHRSEYALKGCKTWGDKNAPQIEALYTQLKA